MKTSNVPRSTQRGWARVSLAPSLAASVVMTLGVLGCGQSAVLRGRIDGLANIVDQAEKNGAKRCAPRELALARAHLSFAQAKIEQGALSAADDHVQIAEPNARAAASLAVPEKCLDNVPEVKAKPGDKDGDGIPDAVDKCPAERETWNGYQDEDGCPDDPDSDNDKIPDSVDQCLLDPEDVDGYLDDDGCPELDNDADGVPDTKDKCPNDPEDPDGFEDEDGCPDPDNDKDTVLDVDDICPNTPGAPGGDRPGCPRKDSPIIVTAHEIRITQQIQFELNKATIKKESWPILDAVVDVLRTNANISIEVQGHTDNKGSAPYNQKLSQQRADSVRQYLVDHGVPASRLISKGFGQSQPLVPNTTEKNRAINRRVQFIRTEAGSPQGELTTPKPK